MSTSRVNGGYTRAACASGAIAVIVALLVLLGWAFDIEVLKSLRPALPSMKPNTALALGFAGASLWLLTATGTKAYGLWMSRACAVLVIAIAAATLVEYAAVWNP